MPGTAAPATLEPPSPATRGTPGQGRAEPHLIGSLHILLHAGMMPRPGHRIHCKGAVGKGRGTNTAAEFSCSHSSCRKGGMPACLPLCSPRCHCRGAFQQAANPLQPCKPRVHKRMVRRPSLVHGYFLTAAMVGIAFSAHSVQSTWPSLLAATQGTDARMLRPMQRPLQGPLEAASLTCEGHKALSPLRETVLDPHRAGCRRH